MEGCSIGFLQSAFNPPLHTLCGTKIILGLISAFLINLKLNFCGIILWKGWAFDTRLVLWPRKPSSFRSAVCGEDKLGFFPFLFGIPQHICGECGGTRDKWLWCWSGQHWGALFLMLVRSTCTSTPSIDWEMPFLDLIRWSVAYRVCKTGILNCVQGVELISGWLKMYEVGTVNIFPLAFLHVY